MLKGETFFNDLQHRNFFLRLLSAYHSVLQAGTAKTRENMPKHERKGERVETHHNKECFNSSRTHLNEFIQ